MVEMRADLTMEATSESTTVAVDSTAEVMAVLHHLNMEVGVSEAEEASVVEASVEAAVEDLLQLVSLSREESAREAAIADSPTETISLILTVAEEAAEDSILLPIPALSPARLALVMPSKEESVIVATLVVLLTTMVVVAAVASVAAASEVEAVLLASATPSNAENAREATVAAILTTQMRNLIPVTFLRRAPRFALPIKRASA